MTVNVRVPTAIMRSRDSTPGKSVKHSGPQRTQKTQITALGERLSGFATRWAGYRVPQSTWTCESGLHPSFYWLCFVLSFAHLASFADPCFLPCSELGNCKSNVKLGP